MRVTVRWLCQELASRTHAGIPLPAGREVSVRVDKVLRMGDQDLVLNMTPTARVRLADRAEEQASSGRRCSPSLDEPERRVSRVNPNHALRCLAARASLLRRCQRCERVGN